MLPRPRNVCKNSLVEVTSMSVSVEQQEAIRVVHLGGEIAIASAMEVKEALVLALASGKDIYLDLEHATDLDITALQLLWAAKRGATESGGCFTIAGEAPESILNGVLEAGFEKRSVGLL